MSYLNGFEFWYHFNWDTVCIVERICQLSCVPVSDTVGLIACLWHCCVDCMSAGWRLTWTMRRVSSTTGGRVIWSSFSNVFTCCSSLSDMIRSSYHALYICYVKTAGWRHGVVVSGVRSMNEVNPRRARLVLGWVTVFGWVYHLGM